MPPTHEQGSRTCGGARVWRPVLGIFAGVNCLFMLVFVLLPFYTREVLGTGPEWYGLLLSGSGMGALAGSSWPVSRSAESQRTRR